MILFNKSGVKNIRRVLRANQTPAEKIIWNELRNNKLDGKKFKRQVSIGSYIVDFYCSSEKLVIELDGEVHFNSTAEKRDSERTKFLESVGLRVIRFENAYVVHRLEEVLNSISACFIKK